MSDEEEFDLPTSYVKTAHEIDPKEAVDKAAPKFDQKRLDDLDQINLFGNVVQFVSDGPLVLVMPSDSDKIYDLDNIICLE